MVAATDEPANLSQNTAQPNVQTLAGSRLRSMFVDAHALLERHVAALNAINVFPVPDGDTGTNMHLTMKAAIEAMNALEVTDAPDVAKALAHGALMGARGNSGVILSQILRGFARRLDGEANVDGATLAGALASASDDAYAALAEPREGTILTVIRAAADAASADHLNAGQVLANAAAAAHAAVEQTPELLPTLKEAGVVDAGGLGLAILLEGLSRSFHGETLDVDLTPEMPDAAGWQSQAASLHDARHGTAGYCTEFVVGGATTSAEKVRSHLQQFGDSLLVVGDESLLRVHVHTATPDDALAYGRTLGDVSQVKVDNMEQQVLEFASKEATTLADIGVVAVAEGPGIEAAFRSIGVTQLIEGGQTMNPSAGEILKAIGACPQDHVIVLPNNSNVIAAAEQAAAEADKAVAVVPSKSIPQGMAAVLALNSDLSFDENVGSMSRATTSVRSAEVTRSVRATVISGRKIRAGQAIGIIEGDLTVVSTNVAQAVHDSITEMNPTRSSLLTVYSGADVRQHEAEALVQELRERHPDLEVELVPGGQRHYSYLLSLE